jgi:hypothetical protein
VPARPGARGERGGAVLLPMVLKGLLLLDLDADGAPVFRTVDDDPTLTGG